MTLKAPGGVDNQSQRLRSVAPPQAADDGVPLSSLRADLPVNCTGLPGANEILAALLVPTDLTAGLKLPANLLYSLGLALVAAKASAAFSISRIPAGATTETVVATLTFAAGATSPTPSTQALVTFGPGDLLLVRGPATQDATLANVFMTVVLKR